ncbi:MAG: type II secretion system protein GspI [Brevundimonas sp.]|uniref:type II secretion system minor pseudopilin GspI n=1 Tax=Brevundimonas sp. TaxID=1871086 RepID=UPI0012291134|nr:type II secretion system minor pseudopilin GspI [Brevundimonas sp.]RZJ18041.1 MAG: type II secretion system protein GspI [Brevundimonas sp.]
MSRRADRSGFSLLELLVALAVFSLAAVALLNLQGESTRSQVRVETRTLAGVVAQNLAVEAVTAPRPPSDGEGRTALAGRDWRWSRSVVATDDPEILRIDIRVADGADPAALLTVFRSATS